MRACPRCGISLITLELTRKAGCPGCYKFFKKEIRALTDDIAPMDLETDLQENLFRSLQEAVANEEYEKAAQIRDKINSADMDVDLYPY